MANNPRTAPLIALTLLAMLFAGACHFSYDPDSTAHLRPMVHEAALAPREEIIVFTMFNHDRSGLFLADYRGWVMRWLLRSSGPLRLSSPVFSPNGRKIAFVWSGTDSPGDLYLMDRDGHNLVQLTAGPNHDQHPCFSYDGRSVYFIRHDRRGGYPVFDNPSSWHSDVYRIEIGTKEIRRVTRQDYHRLWTLALFPDDRHLLLGTTHYQEITAETGHDLWKVDANDARIALPVEPNLQPFAPDPRSRFAGPPFYLQLHRPTLSRNGRLLAFAWSNPLRGKSGCLFPCDQTFLTELRDGRTQKLAQLPGGSTPQDISPGNRYVLISNQAEMKEAPRGLFSSSNLWLVKRDGSDPTNLALDFRAVLAHPPASVRRR